MAKKTEKTPLKKGRATFTIIGEAKVNDYTFNLDNEYESGWTANELNLGIDCGNGNVVYAEMSGGYFPKKDNVLYVHGVTEEDGKKKEDYDDRFTVAWEDRFDENVLETVADSCFITVGIEKDSKDKTFYKKFLSTYDAVKYVSEYLTDGTVINVKGNIAYESNGENVYIKKKITSIALSKAEPENYKATFQQTILLDDQSIGKLDKEKNTIGISAYCVDYIGKPKINGTKIEVKKNFSFPVEFEFAVGDNSELTTKQLAKFFKAKKNEIIEITVEGNIVEGASIVNITKDDIPDDIKELIELGFYDEEEALAKCAVGNTSRERRMIIVKPMITFIGEGDNRTPSVAVDKEKYTPNDLEFYGAYLATLTTDEDDEDKSDETEDDDDDFLSMLNDL